MIAVFADGGAEAGLGHIARSTAVACALQELGLTVACWGLGLTDGLTMDGIDWRRAPREGAEPPVDAQAVVVDSYRVAPAEIAGTKPLVCMHDRGEVPAEAVLVVAPTSASDGARKLTGFRHACLRPGFWNCPSPEIRHSIGRVLVTAGGGALVQDSLNLAVRTKAATPGASVALVCGPYADVEQATEIELIRAPASLRAPLGEADLVVTAAGQTSLEAAACGAPTIVTALVENQLANASRLVESGAAVLLASPDELTEVLAVVAPAAKRRELSRDGQLAVDGQGARRVGRAIAILIGAQR